MAELFEARGVCPCYTDEKQFPYLPSDARAVLKTLHSMKGILNEEECRSVGEATVWCRDELAVAVATKPPDVVQETLVMLEEYKGQWWCGATAKKIKMLSELHQEMLVTEDELERMKGEGGDLCDKLIPTQCTKPPEVVAKTTDVLDKLGYSNEASHLQVLNELFTKHLLSAEECSEVPKKKSWLWEDSVAQILSTKPAEVVQETCQVLMEHGYPKLKTLNELFTRHLLTAEECSEVARKCWEWEDHLALVLSTKPAEVVQEACQVLEKHGCPVKAELKILNALYTRHLLTAEECSEVARKGRWEWEDHLAQVLSTKSAQVVQKACQVLEEHGYPVKKELKMLSELYQETLVTEDEVERMKEEGGDLPNRVVVVQCTKPPEVRSTTADVLDKFGHKEEARTLRALNELFTRHLLTAEECSEVARKGWRWEDQLVLVLLTQPVEAVQETCQVLEKHGCHVKKELKMLSELHQKKLVTEDEVERMKGEGGCLPYRFVHVQYTKPPEVVARTADVLDKFEHKEEARTLRALYALFTRHLLTTEECSEVARQVMLWEYHLAEVLSTKSAEVVQEAFQVLEEHGCPVKTELKMIKASWNTSPDSIHSTDSGYSGSSTTATSAQSTSHLVEHYQKMTMHPHEEEPSLRQMEPSSENATCQESKVHSQLARGGLDTPAKEPDTVKAPEVKLNSFCWIPFGVQSQSVGPEGGKLCLEPSAGAMGGEVGETILLEVPPGAVSLSESVDVHSAVIPFGPFTLPEGYQLGSVVVYIYYDGQRVTCPLRLCLPHWYGGEDHIQDGLTFAMAPHTLKEGESVYRFELLEGGMMLNSHCGELEIDGHCSLFAEVFKEGAKSRYQAVSVEREKGNFTECDVTVTYASHLWSEILRQYRSGWDVGRPITFVFKLDRIEGKLEETRGRDWHAELKNSSQLLPEDVRYESYGITSADLLENAVCNLEYPYAITCAVAYREDLRTMGRPVWVCLNLLGADRDLRFPVRAYEQAAAVPMHSSGYSQTEAFHVNGGKDNVLSQVVSAAPFLELEFLKKHETEFFTVVDPRLNLLKLIRKGVITENVKSSIDTSNNKDAQEILYHHLTHYANVDTLREYCEVAIAADGLPRMQALGRKMKEELQERDWEAD